MKILDYIFAARPLLHLPIWSIYLVSFHYHQQLSGAGFHWLNLLILLSISLMASSAYYLNQIYDYKSDSINHKLGFLQKGIFTHRNLMTGYVVGSLLSIFIASLISFVMLTVLLLLFIIGYYYSVPPLRLKDRPIAGLFANAFGFGFLIPFTVMPDINEHNIGLLGWDNPVYFFLTVSSIYILTTLPDRIGDAATGKKTLGVILSRFSAILIAFALNLLSAYVAFKSRYNMLAFLSVLSSIIIIFTIFIKTPGFMLLAIKLPILLLTLLAGYFFPGYLLFIVALLLVSRIYYKKRFNIDYPKLT